MTLTTNLAKRIFGNIGFVTGKNFGKVGISTSDFLTKEKISIKYLDSNIVKHSVYAGVNNNITVMASNIIDEGLSDFILIFTDKDHTSKISITYQEADGTEREYGAFAKKEGDNWVPISILHQLNIATAFEILTQEGYSWIPVNDDDVIKKLYGDLVSMLDSAIENE